jgi:NADPH2:quinone reductase
MCRRDISSISSHRYLSAFAAGQIKPVVYREVFPLESVAKGLDAIASRQTWGKPVVRIKEDKHGPEAAKL